MPRKRASMRDGPLADLFRATDEAAKHGGTVDSAAEDAAALADRAAEEFDNVQKLPKRTPPVEQPPVEQSPAEEVEAEAAEPLELDIPLEADEPPSDRTLREVDRPAVAFAQAPPGSASSGIDIEDAGAYLAAIRVIGVGGAGMNALERMMEAGISQVDFIALNTDVQQLQSSQAPVQIQIGQGITQGLGSGSDPEAGREAAEESYDQIRQTLRGSDMVFVTAGEGGGTGSGAAPVVARIARELGALTVGIVTTPFGFEGSRRRQQADEGVEELRSVCDTLIVIPNDRLLEVLERDVAMVEAFRIADDVLRQGVQGICDLITMPGLINLDFADVRTVMTDAGAALMGIGFATGDNRAQEAAQRALGSPLIDTEITGARGILLSVAGGDDLTLFEVNEASEVIRQAATSETNIIFGATVDPALDGQLWITVIATGLGGGAGRRGARPERGGDGIEPPSFMRDL